VKSDYFKNIIWSVNTFEESKEFQAGAMALIGALTRSTSAAVEPVHILSSPYATGAPSDFQEAFKGLAEKRMFDFSQVSDIPSMSAGQVLLNQSYSTSSAVQTLIDHAEKRNADAILVATHARVGVPRFFLGSFAETLLLKSPIPVITVNPMTKVRERISKILLPTTFQSAFSAGFKQVAQLAKILDARVTLFYKEPYIPSAFISPPVYEYQKQEKSARALQAKEWQDWAARFHIPVDIHLDQIPGNITEAIDTYAKDKDFDLIAMVSQPDPVLVPLMGSIARQVVRSAPCPVLVIRAEQE
jgi:nucleotide-binding universal stress UspA family protein